MNINIICSAQINKNAPSKETQNRLIYDQHLRHIIFFTLKQVEHSIASRSKECWQSYSNLLKPDNPKIQHLKSLRQSSGIKIGDISGISPHVDSLTEHKISEVEILKKLLLPPLLSEYVYNSSYSLQCNCKEFSRILNHNSSNPTVDIELSNGIISRYINSKLLQYNIRVFKHARFLDIFYSKFYKRTMENESDYFKITNDFTDSINEFMNSAENNEQLNINIINTLDLYHSIFSDFTETINKLLESMTENSQKESKTNVKNCPKINHMDTDTIIGVLKNILNKIQIQCEYINKFKDNSQHLIVKNEQLDNNKSHKLNQSMYNKTSEKKQNESQYKMTSSACKLTYGEDDLLFKDAQMSEKSTIQIPNTIEESESIVNIQELMESNEIQTTIKASSEQEIELIAHENISEPIAIEQSIDISPEFISATEDEPIAKSMAFDTNELIIEECTDETIPSKPPFDTQAELVNITQNQLYHMAPSREFNQTNTIDENHSIDMEILDCTNGNISGIDNLDYIEAKSEEDSIIDELDSDDIILEEPEYDSIIIDMKSIKKSRKIQHFDNYGRYSHRSIIEEIPEENESAQQTESEATDNESDFQKQLMERRKAYEEKFKNQPQDQIINQELTTQFMKSKANESISETLEDKVKNLTTSTIDSSVIDSTYINYEQEQYQPEEANILFNQRIYSSDEGSNHDEVEQELGTLFNQPEYSSNEELANNEIEQRITQIEQRMNQSEQLYNEQFIASLHNDQFIAPLHNEELPPINNEPVRNEPVMQVHQDRPINQDNARPENQPRQLSTHEAINNMPNTSINFQKLLILVVLFIILPALIISWIIVCIIVK